MSEAGDVAGKGAEQITECIDHERREALTRLAKYTAPAIAGHAHVCSRVEGRYRHQRPDMTRFPLCYRAARRWAEFEGVQ